MSVAIPEKLLAACRGSNERQHWLGGLADVVDELLDIWSLRIAAPRPSTEATCAWVVPVERRDGASAVLKIGLPHLEARDEGPGLRFWAGEPTVRLLEYIGEYNALLLERCDPGTSLREWPEAYQDEVIANMLKRLRRTPPPSGEFRHLSVMTAYWSNETNAQASAWPDPGLVQEGQRVFEELSRPAEDNVLLATDLHAGNVLASQRTPWLVIDPKPFVGDPAYDATQHLLNCQARLRAKPQGTIRRFADQAQVDAERLQLWLFARAAAEPRTHWTRASQELATHLSRTLE